LTTRNLCEYTTLWNMTTKNYGWTL